MLTISSITLLPHPLYINYLTDRSVDKYTDMLTIVCRSKVGTILHLWCG